MKYIRQRSNGAYQFRYRENGQHRVSYTDVDLDKVIEFRDNYFSVEAPNEDTRGPEMISYGHRKFGIISDTHLGSKYERLDIVNNLCDTFKQEGIEHVFLPGNWIEGESHFNKFDIDVYGFDNQIQYFIDKWPKNGIHYHLIDGDDHEGWYKQRFGAIPGESLVAKAKAQGRYDLHYHGYLEADVTIRPFEEPMIIRMLHPGDGSAKTVSLKSQQVVDSYEEYEKPDILIIGHYHKAHFLPNYGGVHVIQAGTCQAQSIFMRKKKLKADLGGWIFEIKPNGRISAEFLDFKQGLWNAG